MSTFSKDLRYALRLLRKNPGFTAIAVAALALGIGANTAIFSIVNAVLLRPLPYPDSARVGMLWESSPAQGWKRVQSTGPNFVDYQRRTSSFQEMALMEVGSGTISGLGEPMQAPGLRVTTNFFHLLGQSPLLGRDFQTGESWQTRVVILSHGAWMRFTGGDTGIVGKRLMVDGLPYTIIGVMRPSLWLPVAADAFVPWSTGDLERASRNDHQFSIMVRLKPGVSYDQASADSNRVLHQIGDSFPRLSGWNANVVPLKETLVAGVRDTLLVLLTAVGLVLLIACANIANLLLARATGRARETAIRTALGAARARLVRQWLTESTVLGLAGGLLGLLLALWGVDLLDRLVPLTLRMTDSNAEILRPHLSIDPMVLGFTALISLATGLIFGLAPALAALHGDSAEGLKEGGRNTASRHHRRWRNAFVVAEFALALTLLVSASLAIKSFWKMQQVDPGFSSRDVLALQTELPTDSRYQKDREQIDFYERVLTNLTAIPGTRSAALVSSLPMDEHDQKLSFSVEGRPMPPNNQLLPANYRSVSEQYFSTMGIPLERGRVFSEHDRAGTPVVVVIDRTAADRYWPASVAGAHDPIGQKVRVGRFVAEIVGIVGAVRNAGLDKEPTPSVYFSYRQSPEPLVTLVVANPHPNAIVNAAKQAVYKVDSQQPLFHIRTMREVVSGSQATARFTLSTLLVFAVIGIVLAALGIYGVISYTVAQRRNEIGLRLALGAGAGDVVRMIVGEGMELAAFGLAAGLIGAAASARVMASLLTGISAFDPGVFGVTAVLLALVALAASWLPARRATHIDPVVSLRYE